MNNTQNNTDMGFTATTQAIRNEYRVMIEQDVDTILRQINRGSLDTQCRSYAAADGDAFYICDVTFGDISRTTFLMVWQALTENWAFAENAVDFREVGDNVIFTLTLKHSEIAIY